MKKQILILIVMMFLVTLITADIPTAEKGDCIELATNLNSTDVNITSITQVNHTVIFLNEVMTNNNHYFNYTFCDTNLVGEGIYTYFDNDNQEAYDNKYNITPDGKDSNIQTAIIQVLLILFFLGLGLGFYYIKHKTDLEKWNNSIMVKYENKNFVKVVLASLAYNIMKNSFIIYYLIGLPIIITLTDMAYTYDLNNLLDILKVGTVIYFIGAGLVGIMFLSYVQEWAMDMVEKTKKLDWGLE